MAKLTINVTQEDIDNGVKRNGLCCPIAKALERVGIEASVNINNIHWFVKEKLKNTLVTSKNSPQVRDFIFQFDNCQTVCPATFEMEYEEGSS